jgi:hypothetical protein
MRLLLPDDLGNVLLHVALDNLFDPGRKRGVRRGMAATLGVEPAQLKELPTFNLQTLDDRAVVPPALTVAGRTPRSRR